MSGPWDETFEQILRDHLPFLGPDEQITDDLPLREHGLDSLAVVDLLVVLEGAYAMRMRPEDLTLESFATPGTLWRVLTESMAETG